MTDDKRVRTWGWWWRKPWRFGLDDWSGRDDRKRVLHLGPIDIWWAIPASTANVSHGRRRD